MAPECQEKSFQLFSFTLLVLCVIRLHSNHIGEAVDFIMPNSIITGTGSYIPTVNIDNTFFLGHTFYGADGKNEKSNTEIVQKFKEITCIKERRYVTDDLNTSDIGAIAAERALEGVDRETLDYIIVGHNFGRIEGR